MAVVANLYANALAKALSGQINLPSDSVKIALLSSGYTPNLTSHVNFSDVSANEVSGTGYTAGGQALTSKSVTVTAANSWGTQWAATTATTAGTVVRPTSGNGCLYQAVGNGTTGSTQPTWPTTVGQDVTDGSVTWVCAGESIMQFTSAAAQWTNSTISANYAVLYDAQSGSASTSPLILLVNFGATDQSASGAFTVPPSSLGWFATFPA